MLKICRPAFKFQNLIEFIILIYFTENLQKTDEYIVLMMNQQTRMTNYVRDIKLWYTLLTYGMLHIMICHYDMKSSIVKAMIRIL